MSGNNGWGGRDRASDFDYTPANDGFSKAYQPYSRGPDPDNYSKANQALNNGSVKMTAGRSVAWAALSQALGRVDLSPRKRQVTTKKNVLIVSLDRTGSVRDWQKEIFDRMAVLYTEAQKYLGESLEILFVAFGDYQLCRDSFEVAPLGDGPILDTYILSLNSQANGGGNGIESSEFGAVYTHTLLDTSSAQNVFFFTVTDEGFYPNISEAESYLGVDAGSKLTSTKDLFRELKVRMNVYNIFALTETGREDRRARKQWEDALGEESVIPLDDARRVVDVMLGTMAKVTGQYDQFSVHLGQRQGGTAYGAVNQNTVHTALSRVVGVPQAPSVKAGTKSLLGGMAAAVPPAGQTRQADDPDPTPTPAGGKSQIVPLAAGTKSLLAPKS